MAIEHPSLPICQNPLGLPCVPGGFSFHCATGPTGPPGPNAPPLGPCAPALSWPVPRRPAARRRVTEHCHMPHRATLLITAAVTARADHRVLGVGRWLPVAPAARVDRTLEGHAGCRSQHHGEPRVPDRQVHPAVLGCTAAQLAHRRADHRLGERPARGSRGVAPHGEGCAQPAAYHPRRRRVSQAATDSLQPGGPAA